MVDTVPRKVAVPLVAFAAGSVVSLLIGVYGAQHEPTFRPINTFGFGSMIQMKVWFAIGVGVLAVGQLIGALWLYGRLKVPAPAWLGKAHRASGTLAILLSLPVAFHCLWSLGFQSGANTPTRVVVHSIVGSAVYGALVVKVVAVRSKTAPGWLLPIAGGLLFSVLIAVVLTSAGWYLGEFGLPKSSPY
ncbi:MAG: DUF6529 family protein [Aeromicrobium sp.]